MIFRHPQFFALLFAVMALVIWSRRRQKNQTGFLFSTGVLLDEIRQTRKTIVWKNLIFLRAAALILMIAALARPQTVLEQGKIRKEGIDIMLTLDCSTSMLAEDFTWAGRRVNRSEAVKKVVREFIDSRTDDRIGMVGFGSVAYTFCPLTLDHLWLLKTLERLKPGVLQDGTAIGTALMATLKRLESSKAKSKIVVLLTDGINNAGPVAPLMAAEAARALSIKIYTIGVGGKGPVRYPFQDLAGNVFYRDIQLDMDEASLSAIAEKTEGRFYRATDTDSLKDIYAQINKLEKAPEEEKGYQQYGELMGFFLGAALTLLVIEIVLRHALLRKLP